MFVMLQNKELVREVVQYKKSLIINRKFSNAYLIITIFLLLSSCISLAIIFIDHDSEVPFFNSQNDPKGATAWAFIISISINFLILLISVPISSVWFFKTHNKLQSHMPFILNTKIIDICSIIVGAFDLITAVLAASAPIIYGRENESWAWFADTKVLLYTIMCSLIFFIWAILIPFLQDKIVEKDNEYFAQYSMFEYSKIKQYLKHLSKLYDKRVKSFNQSIKNKIDYKDIRFTPVHADEPFSYDTRRVFKGHKSKYGDEWYLIKYCLFAEVYSEILKGIHSSERKVRENMNKFLRNRDKKKNYQFNKHLLEVLEKRLKQEE